MTLKEARKLAAHSPYDMWCGHIEKDTQRLAIHCYMNFDEVVAALSKCLYAMEAIKDDPTIEPFFTEGVAVLASAKEVEI
jgi:hypothetical protein